MTAGQVRKLRAAAAVVGSTKQFVLEDVGYSPNWLADLLYEVFIAIGTNEAYKIQLP